VSAFDDEFGLFGDDEGTPEEEERKPTLGARKIASSETIIDDIEPEDDRPPRRRPGAGSGSASTGSGGYRTRTGGTGERRPFFDRDRGPRTTGDPAVAQARAVSLLDYLARKLVSKPDEVIVEVVEGNRGPVIELEVHPDDFGKVIGKGGRVAQALRTIVRAAAEGKVTIDIVDVEDDDEPEETAPVQAAETVATAAETEEAPDDAPEDAVAAAPAKKKRAPAKAGAKKKSAGAAAKKTAKKR
jgi:predicted RNA-binding protein YlqC (UPF0109 family)